MIVSQLGPRLKSLISRLHDNPPLTVPDAKSVLQRAELCASELLPLAEFAHCPSESYGRRILVANQRFELLVMSWAPGDVSAIHDHGRAEWGAVQVFGPAEHAEYALGSQMELRSVESQTEGDVLAVPPELIHQMGNPSSSPFVSLHLYGRSYGEGAVTENARIFDLLHRRIYRTDGGVFFAMKPSERRASETGVGAGADALSRHHVQLANRISKIRSAGLERGDLDDTWTQLTPWHRPEAA